MSTTDPVFLDDLISRTHHVALCVENFDRASAFYVDVLGFRIEDHIEYRDEANLAEVVGLPGAKVRWAMLVRDDFRIELFKYYEPQGANTPIRQCDSGYTHLAFQVDDVDKVYERVLSAGYATTSPPREMRNGRAKVLYLLEPEGNVTELIEFPDRPRET